MVKEDSRFGADGGLRIAPTRSLLRSGASRFASTALLLAVATVPPFSAALAQSRNESGSTAHALDAAVGLQEAFAQVADEMEPAVCTILTTRGLRPFVDSSDPSRIIPNHGGSRRSVGTGSGVIIDKDGWVLTNDHVVGGADRVTIRLHDGRELVGTVHRDYRSDLALVKISSPTPLPAARLGDSDTVRIGHWAIAIGSPYKYEGSFSVGVISSLYRQQRIAEFGAGTRDSERFYPDMMQTDAAINPGNSGGPLCNIHGEVIGVNTAIESDGAGSVGIGFAIPINIAKFVISQLMQKGRVDYGYLGVNPTTVTARLTDALKTTEGALLESDPSPGSPGAIAGLQAADVIVSINDKPIRNELDLRLTVAHTPPGTTVELVIVRDGVRRTVKAKLTSPPDTYNAHTQPIERASLGIEVQPLTPRLAEEARVPADTQGVSVKSIAQDSPAADVDALSEGVIIVKINESATPNVRSFEDATVNLKPGDTVRVFFLKNNTKHFALVSVQ